MSIQTIVAVLCVPTEKNVAALIMRTRTSDVEWLLLNSKGL